MPRFPLATPSQLAAVVRARRAELGLTQKQAGGKVGLLPKTISVLESEPERSSVASLYKLLSALELELSVKPKSSRDPAHAHQDW